MMMMFMMLLLCSQSHMIQFDSQNFQHLQFISMISMVSVSIFITVDLGSNGIFLLALATWSR